MAHARLGPSNHRWPNCPGSVREESVYPDSSSEAAIDGTGSHLLLELCLQQGVNAEHFDKQIIGAGHEDMSGGWLIEPDRIKRVQQCIDYVATRIAELKKQYDIPEGSFDSRVTVQAESISNIGEHYDRNDWWGTCDITITVVVKGIIKFVEVIDYKDGRMWVSETLNSQLLSYLGGQVLGKADYLDEGRMTIVQPKTGVPRSSGITLENLEKECDELALAASKTDDDNAPLVAGKHCQWCKHKPDCNAKDEQDSLTVAKIEPSGILERVHTSLETLTNDELGDILGSRPTYNKAFEKVETEIIKRLNDGQAVTGYKIAPGKAKRVWGLDEEAMVKKFKSMKLKQGEYYPSSLISPAAAEKLEQLTDKQRENMNKLITTVAGKDKLTAVTVAEKKSATEMLADLPSEAVATPPVVTSFL